jgi:tRNA (adenine57-N1/adenine58-N1)-methyltransferase
LASRPFGDVSVEEVLVRAYKPVPARLRPEDRMIAHSAFLVFARKIAAGDESLGWMPEKKRRAYLGKLAMAQRMADRAEVPTEPPDDDEDAI